MFSWIKSKLLGDNPSTSSSELTTPEPIDGQLISYDMSNSSSKPRTLFQSCTLQISEEESKVIVKGYNEVMEFEISEALQFSSVNNSQNVLAFCWRDQEHFHKWYIFKLAAKEEDELESQFQIYKYQICRCLFTKDYEREPKGQEEDEEVYRFCGTMEFPFHLETLVPLSNTKSSTTTRESSVSNRRESSTKEKEPPVQSLYPSPPIAVDELEQVKVYENEHEVLRVACDFFTFDSRTKMFQIQQTNVHICIGRVGSEKDYQYNLTIIATQNKKKIVIFQQDIDSNMNPQFYKEHHSIVWRKLDPFSLRSVIIKDLDEEDEFKELLTACIYENRYCDSWQKLSSEDQKCIVQSFQMDSVTVVEKEDGYLDQDLIDFDEEEEEEEEEEEHTSSATISKKDKTKDKNELLADSSKHGRAFVSRGNNIGIFKRDDDDVEYVTMISNIKTAKGTNLHPKQMVLHYGDRNLLMLGNNQKSGDEFRGKVYQFDLEKQKIVEEWQAVDDLVPIYQTAPIHKYAEMDNQQVVAGLNSNTIFGLDPRIHGHNKLVGNVNDITHRSNPEFTCHCTSYDGFLAVGSEKGEIRLFSGVPGLKNLAGKKLNPKSAKTLFPGFGDPIRSIDVTKDGKWVLATCDTYLIVLGTEFNGDHNGFEEKMGVHKPAPRRLQLKAEDVVLLEGKIKFTPAKFNTGKDNETWIVTSTGCHIIQWNFRKVKQNHLTDYTMKRLGNEIMTEQFINVGLQNIGYNAPIIVALPDDVRLEKRVQQTTRAYATAEK